MDIWTDYKPLPESVLLKSEPSDKRSRWALSEMCSHAERLSGLDLECKYQMLLVADEIIGVGKPMESSDFGKFLHIRRFLITQFPHKRSAVKSVKRWDRNLRKQK